MAIFREYRRQARLGEEDVATLHFVVGLDENFEQMAWGMLSESHDRLERDIREAVAETLGPEYTVSRFLYTRGSIEILIGIGAGLYAVYVGASRYKNLIESLTLLVRQLRGIFQRFFGRNDPGTVTVTATWIPGPTLQQQAFATPRGTAWPGFSAVLWYLVLSHAALLAVVIWQAFH